jgi:hypothetical protein
VFGPALPSGFGPGPPTPTVPVTRAASRSTTDTVPLYSFVT